MLISSRSRPSMDFCLSSIDKQDNHSGRSSNVQCRSRTFRGSTAHPLSHFQRRRLHSHDNLLRKKISTHSSPPNRRIQLANGCVIRAMKVCLRHPVFAGPSSCLVTTAAPTGAVPPWILQREPCTSSRKSFRPSLRSPSPGQE